MKQGTNMYPHSAQALEAYWNAQNRKIRQLEQFVAQGGERVSGTDPGSSAN